MYKNFNELYNETYIDFYNTCTYKKIISSVPIPYKIDESLNAVGRHDNGIVILNNPTSDTPDEIRQLTSTLYHEFTHYYDEAVFKHIGYSDEGIRNLMLTYSEIHAAYNGMFMFFNLKNLSVRKRIDLNKMKFSNRTMTEHIAFQITKEIHSMNNILGFKNAMYLLGEKRALLKIAKDVLAINRAYSFKRIPESIREEIINIDQLVDITSYENIAIDQINKNKLKVEDKLRRMSIKNIPIPDIAGIEDIKRIINDL